MSNLSIFESTNVPAHVASNPLFGASKDLGNSAVGFPVMSIKGKKWAYGHGDDKIIVREPGTKYAAQAINVVIVDYSPNVTKVFYEEKYNDKAERPKPTCYSDNGSEPAADAMSPQSKKCATCAHNQWGSRISESGAKAKSCQDNRRLAIAMPNALDEPMLLRIPPTSLKNLAFYQELLAQKGFGMRAMVTELSFDPERTGTVINFEPVDFITEEQMAKVAEVVEMPVTKQIIGVEAVARELPESAPPAQAEVESKPEPVKAAPKKAAKKPEPKPEPEVEAAPSALESELDDVFAELDGFDD